MGKTVKDVMNKAISFLDTRESPANSNNVIFNTHYYGKTVSGSIYPWCCAYIWDIFRLAGASNLFYDGKKTAYCPTVESWGKSKKLTVDKSKGKYGDIVLFDFYGKNESCHIGFIVQKNSDGTYKTIEGNTAINNDDNGGCVMYRTRNQSSIRCIIRPKYSKSSSTSVTSTTKATIPTETTSSTSKLKITSNVKSIQTWLNTYYKTGLVVDDIYGAKTKAALIKAWQTEVGELTVDGIFGIKSKTAASFHIIKNNSTGILVTIWQAYLVCHGYNPNGIDGIFGSGCHTATVAFQKANGLTQDGQVGKNTWTKAFS